MTLPNWFAISAVKTAMTAAATVAQRPKDR